MVWRPRPPAAGCRLTAGDRAAFRAGVTASTPILLGMIPWGIVAGVAMMTAGLTRVQATGMSAFVYAASAQLAVLPLMAVKAPLWLMLATAFMVNLRYVIYSAVLAPHFASLSRAWRIGLSYLTVDGMFAAFVGRYQARPDDPHKHWFYLGGSVVVWCVWQASNAVGVFAGSLIPASWSLEFAGTLSLIALLMPLLYDRAVVSGAIAAGLVALVARPLPMNLGIVVSVLAGVSVGLAVAPFVPGRMRGPR